MTIKLVSAVSLRERQVDKEDDGAEDEFWEPGRADCCCDPTGGVDPEDSDTARVLDDTERLDGRTLSPVTGPPSAVGKNTETFELLAGVGIGVGASRPDGSSPGGSGTRNEVVGWIGWAG
jgi:hypothetical protein